MQNVTQLKKGDTVAVLSGKEKGKKAKIIEVDRKANKIVLEGLNIHHKFEKPRSGKAGTKISFPAAMPASKVIMICPHCGEATRIGHQMLDNGTKQRVCKQCKKAV